MQHIQLSALLPLAIAALTLFVLAKWAAPAWALILALALGITLTVVYGPAPTRSCRSSAAGSTRRVLRITHLAVLRQPARSRLQPEVRDVTWTPGGTVWSPSSSPCWFAWLKLVLSGPRSPPADRAPPGPAPPGAARHQHAGESRDCPARPGHSWARSRAWPAPAASAASSPGPAEGPGCRLCTSARRGGRHGGCGRRGPPPGMSGGYGRRRRPGTWTRCWRWRNARLSSATPGTSAAST